MVSCLIILFEAIAFWICLNVVFKYKFNIKFWDIVFVLLYVIIFCVCENIFKELAYICLLVLSVIWCGKRYLSDIKKSIICVVFSIFCVGIIEVVAVLLVGNVATNVSDEIYVFLMSLITSVIALILYIIRFYFKPLINVLKKNFRFMLYVVCVVCLFFVVRNNFEKTRLVDVKVLLPLLLLLIIVTNEIIRLQQKKYAMQKREMELDMQRRYEDVYKDMITSMRHKQHDYKNQLAAIYSMHITATDFEELVDLQKEYIGAIENDSDMDTILLKCSNSVLAGYVYTYCSKLKSEDIDVKVKVNIFSDVFVIPTHEIIEVLGIMLNNAYECIRERENDRCIKVELCETVNSLIVKVENVSEEILFKDISKLFEDGCSTKGSERGVGLASIKRIGKKYNADVVVTNKDVDDKNWFVILFEIKK